jgi:hypothetical protein
LSVKAQGTLVVVREGDLNVPFADQIHRLRLTQGNATRFGDYEQRNEEARMTNDE